MFWYIKEEGWEEGSIYQMLHGPFKDEKEAKQWKRANTSQVTFSIFNSQDLLQPM